MKIPKDFRDKEEELRPIIDEVEKLNERLKEIIVYQSYKPKDAKNPLGITKKRLQLKFILLESSQSRHDPLPREIRIDR